jgi:hypothetical protein
LTAERCIADLSVEKDLLDSTLLLFDRSIHKSDGLFVGRRRVELDLDGVFRRECIS